MRVLIKDEGFLDDDLLGAEFVEFEHISAQNKLLDLPSDGDPDQLVPIFAKLDAIRIPFVSFADGRGFSLARRLRSLGYTGRLRAYGHLIADQYSHARRCGFDEVEIDEALSLRQPVQNWQMATNLHQQSYQDRLLRAG